MPWNCKQCSISSACTLGFFLEIVSCNLHMPKNVTYEWKQDWIIQYQRRTSFANINTTNQIDNESKSHRIRGAYLHVILSPKEVKTSLPMSTFSKMLLLTKHNIRLTGYCLMLTKCPIDMWLQNIGNNVYNDNYFPGGEILALYLGFMINIMLCMVWM